MNAPLPALADTHCHLMLPEFEADLEPTLLRSRQAGVTHILMPGVDLPSSRRGVALAETHPGLFAAVGVHPHYAGGWDGAALPELRALAASGRVVAVGEIGLDYVRDLAPREDQRRAFRDQLELAADLELPVVVHNRDAIEDLLADLVHWSAQAPAPLQGRAGTLHAFSAGAEAAAQAVAAGFYLGVAGPLTYPKAEERRAITAELPEERLLVETDSPYLTPHPWRGDRNEPANVRLIAARLAEVRGMAFESLAQSTSENATRLFGWNDGTDNRNLL